MTTQVRQRAKDQAWQEELAEVRASHRGLLRPADVVEYARDPKTALHFKFVWDDTEAARQYRLWQARELIQIVVTVLPNTNKPVRVYVSLESDRDKEGGGYRELTSVLSDAVRRKALVAEALAEFDRWKRKYETLVELSKIFEAREKVKP